MKKTFLTRRNAFLLSGGVSWGGYALIIVLLLIAVRLIVPNVYFHIFAPVFRSADALASTSHSFFGFFNSSAELTKANERLLQENAALANENEALIQKEASLEALLGTSESNRIITPAVLAGVIARPPESPYDTLIVDKGTHSGVVVGQEAFGPGNVPLGVVTTALADFSRITLFSAPGMSAIGSVGSKNIPLTVMGGGGGVLNASLTRPSDVAVGDLVFLPGPGALPAGKVVRIDGDPTSPSMTLRIQPRVNLFTLYFVTIRDAGESLKGTLMTATTTKP
ncbi:MAG: Rod shape-determining protein MreC [Parcubacteria group bacterium]|nr:Rod shape-determining protein MreC [Parcubacteria group bacterium]